MNITEVKKEPLFIPNPPQPKELCVDVSWISPFANERELIIRVGGLAISEPCKWDLDFSTSLIKTLVIIHADSLKDFMNRNY